MGERPILEISVATGDGVHGWHLGPGASVAVDGHVTRAVVGPALGQQATPLRHRLIGRWRPTDLAVHLRGRRIDHLSTAARVRRGLAIVADGPVAADVSIRDHLAVVGGPARADAALAEAPLLAGRGADPAGVLSGGERRVLGWLRADLLDPTAVVLDRATDGLGDDVVRWAGDVVRAWRAADVTFLVHVGRPEERAWLDAGR